MLDLGQRTRTDTGPASTTSGSFYTYTFQTNGVGGSTSTIKLTHQ